MDLCEFQVISGETLMEWGEFFVVWEGVCPASQNQAYVVIECTFCSSRAADAPHFTNNSPRITSNPPNFGEFQVNPTT